MASVVGVCDQYALLFNAVVVVRVMPEAEITGVPKKVFVHVPSSGSQKADHAADHPIQSDMPKLTGDSGGSVTLL